MMLLKILATIFILFALSRVFIRLKQKEMRPGEAIFWSIIWILVLVALYLPEHLISSLGTVFGIQRGIDFLVYISIIFLFYMVFRTYASLDKMQQQITSLVTNQAINQENQKIQKKKRNS